MSVDTNDVYIKERARRTVRITVSDGTVLEGSLVVPKTRGIAELLNGPQPFVEFESAKGERIYVAKPAIRSVQAIDYPRRQEPPLPAA
jgi:hypothetical protein